MTPPARSDNRPASQDDRRDTPRYAARPDTGETGAGDRRVTPVDHRVARIAERRRGVVSVDELVAAGLTRHGIASRVRRGWLHRRHRGVFSVGHLGDIPLAREAAALLACGHGAALSHRSAAVIWELLEEHTADPDVSVPPGRNPQHAGITVHRPRVLDAQEIRTREGLQVTSIERTIKDLAPVLPEPALERLVAEALAKRLVRRDAIVLRDGAPGAAKLRSILAPGPRFTRSEAERVLLTLVRRAGLPLPETNVRVAGFEVDALWSDKRLVVEVDGFAFHGDRRSFEQDRRRDQRLRAAGYEVIRITWRQLTEEPERIVALLAQLLR